MLSDSTAIGLGAVAGALCRYHIGNFANRAIVEHPKRFSSLSGWHTAGINIFGSLIFGFLGGIPDTTSITLSNASSGNNEQLIKGISQKTRLFAAIGFCGSFTTFSTYSFDVVGLLGKGETQRAFSYIVANNIGSISAAYVGFKAARRIFY